MKDWPDPVDTSRLTDADWAEINKLRRASEKGDKAGFAAFKKLFKRDPVRCSRILSAYYPEKMREALKNELAEAGLTEDDLRELLRKAEGSRH